MAVHLTVAITDEFLCGRLFSLAERSGDVLATSLAFSRDGALSGYWHGRHSSWELKDGFLYFRDHRGQLSDVFDRMTLIGHEVVFQGRFHNHSDDYWLTLRPLASIDLPLFSDPDHGAPARGNKRLAVLVRTHRADEKFHALMSKLESGRTEFELFAMADVSSRELDISSDRVINFSQVACIKMGLTRGQPHLFHQFGDVAMVFASRSIPGFDHYLMLDDDVDLTSGDATFINQIGRKLKHEAAHVDLIGLLFRPQPISHNFGSALSKILHASYMHYCYFPFIVLSSRAVNFMFLARQWEFARGRPIEERVMCEGFVPSILMASGFRCIDLNALMPGSYSERMMVMQVGPNSPGLPMSAQVTIPAGEQMIHPVYSDGEFVQRVIANNTSDGNTDWGAVRVMLERFPNVPASKCVPQ